MNWEHLDQVLWAIWKWKALTTAAIHEMIFPHDTAKYAYQKLWQMRRMGYIQHITDKSCSQYAWTLTRKGFKRRPFEYEELREEGYATEHFEHDLLCSAIQIGDWHESPEIQERVSEQELRRFPLCGYEEDVPRDEIHRPDGYWVVEYCDGPAAIALEVELKGKRGVNYEILGMYYGDRPQIYRTVWVVKGPRILKRIRKHLLLRREDADKHNFIFLEDFIAKGWSAAFVEGPDKGQTISWLLSGGLAKTPRRCCTDFTLDMRKGGAITGPSPKKFIHNKRH